MDLNLRSAIYYLNQVPPRSPPPNLSPTAVPDWHRITSSHEYQWHDARLGALAAVARAPGAVDVGRWIVPMRVDGRPTSVAGGLYYAPNPSLVWFWPIVVLIACALAARRLHRHDLDVRVAFWLSVAILIALGVGAGGQVLEGRPNVTSGDLVTLGVILVLVAICLVRLLSRGPGIFLVAVISTAALFEGLDLVGTLVQGFVLAGLPAFVERAATAGCLAAGSALFIILLSGTLGQGMNSARQRVAAASAGGGGGDGADDDRPGPISAHTGATASDPLIQEDL
ncbi:MAG: hypothetical protein ACR2LV_09255 [Solirubrobacteraceae bacterium]